MGVDHRVPCIRPLGETTKNGLCSTKWQNILTVIWGSGILINPHMSKFRWCAFDGRPKDAQRFWSVRVNSGHSRTGLSQKAERLCWLFEMALRENQPGNQPLGFGPSNLKTQMGACDEALLTSPNDGPADRRFPNDGNLLTPLLKTYCGFWGGGSHCSGLNPFCANPVIRTHKRQGPYLLRLFPFSWAPGLQSKVAASKSYSR